MAKVEFKLIYDDNIINIIGKISSCLSNFGLTINTIEEGDGWEKYSIEYLDRECDIDNKFGG